MTRISGVRSMARLAALHADAGGGKVGPTTRAASEVQDGQEEENRKCSYFSNKSGAIADSRISFFLE